MNLNNIKNKLVDLHDQTILYNLENLKGMVNN